MKKLLASLCFGLFCLTRLAPSWAMTSTPYGGVMAMHSGKCLAIEAASTASGARVLQATCRHASSDQWQLQPAGDGFYQLVTLQSQLCLGVTRASTASAAQAVQLACTLADNSQLWSMTPQNGGYALRSKNSGLCLDVFGRQQTDAAALIQYACSGSTNQTFAFERAVFVNAVPVSIEGQQSGQCVDVAGASVAAGTAIIQWPCQGAGNESWTLRNVGQAVNIVGLASGQCLDVSAASLAAGAAVIQWPCNGGTNQQWRLQAFNSAWRLVAVHSGLCLNVSAGGAVPGQALIQGPCVGSQNELWSLHKPTQLAQWTGVIPTTVDPVAAANLPNGKVLAWSAESTLSFGGGPSGQTYTEVLDPIGQTQAVFLTTNTGHDMFCPGTAVLADGRILVNGGIDSTRTSLYDPATGAWSASGAMNIGRGYQGTVMAADGSVLTLGGSWSGPVGGKTGERWTTAGNWKLLSGIPADPVLTADAQGTFRADNHLWLQVLSGGRLLHAGPSKQMNWINPSANAGVGSITPAGLRGDDADSMNGNAVQYDVDRLLKVGGAPSYGYGSTSFKATPSAQIIDASGPNVAVTRVAPMAYSRAFGNAVTLPNGQVVVVGGQTYALPFSDDNAILVPELWDPSTQVFERLPAMATPRTYHSVALLLPDARVWVGGGGLCGSCATNHANYEILTPPYLLNADGSATSRPAITSVSTATPSLGQALQITTSQPVTSFALMRLASVTHTVNNDQRRIPLIGSSTDGTHYQVSLPSDAGSVVPGYYMLFALDARGVPSVASTLRITAL